MNDALPFVYNPQDYICAMHLCAHATCIIKFNLTTVSKHFPTESMLTATMKCWLIIQQQFLEAAV